jgi:hypothetical protein
VLEVLELRPSSNSLQQAGAAPAPVGQRPVEIGNCDVGERRGGGLARAPLRFAPPRTHLTPDSLTYRIREYVCGSVREFECGAAVTETAVRPGPRLVTKFEFEAAWGGCWARDNEVALGLVRVVASHRRASTSYQIR